MPESDSTTQSVTTTRSRRSTTTTSPQSTVTQTPAPSTSSNAFTWTTLFVALAMLGVVIAAFFAGGLSDRLFVLKPIDSLLDVAKLSRLRPENNQGESSGLGQIIQQSATIGSVADVVDLAGKSVVTVAIKTQRPVLERVSPNGLFGLNFQVPSGKVEEVQQDIGTGFIVDKQNDLVVTNRHVVSDTSADYKVIDSDNKEYEVTDIYRDPVSDLAILKVEGIELPALPMGDSEKVRVGDGVIAIGTALGEFRNTVTTGVISGKGRGIDASAGTFSETERLDNVLQTDAAINPGNSGGPLISSAGEVIGVNAAVTQGAQNIGFAIAINAVKEMINNFNQTGQFERPMLGVKYAMIPIRTALMNDVPQGALIQEVVPDSAADKAGLKANDIISKLDGQALKDTPLVEVINKKKIGDTLKVTYWRDGEEKEMTITLGKQSQ